jgi:hypothetical protein
LRLDFVDVCKHVLGYRIDPQSTSAHRSYMLI